MTVAIPVPEETTPLGQSESGPVEKKVWGGLGGSATGSALAGLVIYVLDVAVYRHSSVPAELSGPLLVLLPLAFTFLGAYITPHTFRDDPAALKQAAKEGLEPSLLDRNAPGYRESELPLAPGVVAPTAVPLDPEPAGSTPVHDALAEEHERRAD